MTHFTLKVLSFDGKVKNTDEQINIPKVGHSQGLLCKVKMSLVRAKRLFSGWLMNATRPRFRQTYDRKSGCDDDFDLHQMSTYVI